MRAREATGHPEAAPVFAVAHQVDARVDAASAAEWRTEAGMPTTALTNSTTVPPISVAALRAALVALREEGSAVPAVPAARGEGLGAAVSAAQAGVPEAEGLGAAARNKARRHSLPRRGYPSSEGLAA